MAKKNFSYILIVLSILMVLLCSYSSAKDPKKEIIAEKDSINFLDFDSLEVDTLVDSKKRYRGILETCEKALGHLHRKLLLDYDVKSSWDCLKFRVSRETIVEDTFKMLEEERNTFPNLYRQLYTQFPNEYGIDLGGLTQEWFTIFSTEVFNPKFELFSYTDSNSSTVEINPSSETGKRGHRHLLDFELIGLFTAMAVYHEKLINVQFSIPLLKTLLHRPISLNDVKITNPDYHSRLKSITNGDPATMGLYFIDPTSKDTNVVPLIKNGDKIPVTKKNKIKFIRLLINWKYIRNVEKQMSAFLNGFNSLIPLKMLQPFTADELQSIIGGDIIDVDIWKKYTKYEKGYNHKSKQITWFWKAVKSFTPENRSKLMMFVTATSRFAINSYRPFKFAISKEGEIGNVPNASTWTNTLMLPPYESYEDVLQKLNTVINLPPGYGLKIE